MIVTDEMVQRARSEFVDRIVDHANPHWGTQRPDYLAQACRAAGYVDVEGAANFFVRAALEAALRDND